MWPRRLWNRTPSDTPYAEIAQLVERQVEALRVAGSSPALGTTIKMKRRNNKMGNEKLTLENRIALLTGRGKDNGKIVKKLQRRLRKLNNN